MTTKDTGAHFEISINGVPRTHRDVRETAIEAALYHKQRVPTEEVRVRDLTCSPGAASVTPSAAQ